MIGSIKFRSGEHAGTVAVLNDSGVWEHPDPIQRWELNADYSPLDHGPSCMPMGMMALSAAARELDAEEDYQGPAGTLPEGVIS